MSAPSTWMKAFNGYCEAAGYDHRTTREEADKFISGGQLPTNLFVIPERLVLRCEMNRSGSFYVLIPSRPISASENTKITEIAGIPNSRGWIVRTQDFESMKSKIEQQGISFEVPPNPFAIHGVSTKDAKGETVYINGKRYLVVEFFLAAGRPLEKVIVGRIPRTSTEDAWITQTIPLDNTDGKNISGSGYRSLLEEKIRVIVSKYRQNDELVNQLVENYLFDYE